MAGVVNECLICKTKLYDMEKCPDHSCLNPTCNNISDKDYSPFCSHKCAAARRKADAILFGDLTTGPLFEKPEKKTKSIIVKREMEWTPDPRRPLLPGSYWHPINVDQSNAMPWVLHSVEETSDTPCTVEIRKTMGGDRAIMPASLFLHLFVKQGEKG